MTKDMYNEVVDILEDFYLDSIDDLMYKEQTPYKSVPAKEFKTKRIKYLIFSIIFTVLFGIMLAGLIHFDNFIIRMMLMYVLFVNAYILADCLLKLGFSHLTKDSIDNVNHHIHSILTIGKILLDRDNEFSDEENDDLYNYIKYLHNSVLTTCDAIFNNKYPDYNCLLYYTYVDSDIYDVLKKNSIFNRDEIANTVKRYKKNFKIIKSIIEIVLVGLLTMQNYVFDDILSIILCIDMGITGVSLNYNAYIEDNIKYYDSTRKRLNLAYTVIDFDFDKAMKFLERF